MSVPSPDNPAERLRTILHDFMGHPRKSSALAAWKDALGLPDSMPNVRALRYLSAVADLPQQVRHALADRDEQQQELLLRHLKDVEAGMEQMPSVGSLLVDHFAGNFNSLALYGLENASAVLHREQPRFAVDGDLLRRVRGDVNNVIFLLREDEELEPHFRAQLLEKFREILRLLNDVRTRGRAAAEDAFDLLLGTVGRTAPELAKYEGSDLRKGLGLAVTSLVTMLQISLTGLQITGEVRDMIEPPTAESSYSVTITNDGSDNDTVIVMPGEYEDAGAARSGNKKVEGAA